MTDDSHVIIRNGHAPIRDSNSNGFVWMSSVYWHAIPGAICVFMDTQILSGIPCRNALGQWINIGLIHKSYICNLYAFRIRVTSAKVAIASHPSPNGDTYRLQRKFTRSMHITIIQPIIEWDYSMTQTTAVCIPLCGWVRKLHCPLPLVGHVIHLIETTGQSKTK